MTLSVRAALRLPLLVVRTPLELLDDQVVRRILGPDNPVHRTLSLGLHTLDHLAGATPAHTAPRAQTAPASRTSAHDDVTGEDVETAADRPAPEPIEPGEQAEIVERAEEILEAQEFETLAGELAENDEIRRVQAEIRAKQQVEDEHGQG